LHDFARHYRFDPETERYLIHITTGTHVAQICMFLLTEARYFPATLLQTSPPQRQPASAVGRYALIDLDLSRYDQIAARFAREQQESTAVLKSGIALQYRSTPRVPGLCDGRLEYLGRQLSRVVGVDHAPGDTGRGWAHLGGAGAR
jgi:sigma54-dependent transcription regulator